MNVLEIDEIDVYYGKVQALRNVSLTVQEGETVAVLGANGAGKTTLLKTIMGLARASKGDVTFFGQSIVAQPAHRICILGAGYVPEGRRVFEDLTVFENLAVGSGTIKERAIVGRQLSYVHHLFPLLKERNHQMAGTLSGGEQQMLTIGRALMTNPKLLLLDEPSMGLAPLIIRDIFKALTEINANGTTVLLVEQSAHLALKVSARAYVLESGRLTYEGTSADFSQSDALRKAYLGV